MILLTCFALLTKGNTQASPPDTSAQETSAKRKATDQPAKPCPILASRGWKAKLASDPRKRGVRHLVVTGEIDLPTPGYKVTWKMGPADRANPPGQRIELILTPPDGIVLQAVTPTKVKIKAKAVFSRYREIIVRCGDSVVASIKKINAGGQESEKPRLQRVNP